MKKKSYILKTVHRKFVEVYQLQDILIMYKTILMDVDFNMISKTLKTFKDENRLYFLQEYVSG